MTLRQKWRRIFPRRLTGGALYIIRRPSSINRRVGEWHGTPDTPRLIAYGTVQYHAAATENLVVKNFRLECLNEDK